VGYLNCFNRNLFLGLKKFFDFVTKPKNTIVLNSFYKDKFFLLIYLLFMLSNTMFLTRSIISILKYILLLLKQVNIKFENSMCPYFVWLKSI